MSVETFLLPDVGEGLVEAEIVTWKVAVGDRVSLNQPIVDIETAKAVVELPSPFEGIVVTLHAAVGDVVAVDEPLVTIDTVGTTDTVGTVNAQTVASAGSGEGEREAVLVGYGVAPDGPPSTRTRRRRTGARREETTAPSTPRAPRPAPTAVSGSPATSLAHSPRTTPPVRLYARQRGVDLAAVRGSGRDGLITRADVERFVPTTAAPTASRDLGPSRFAGRELASWTAGPLEERIAVKGVLRSMADAMVSSAFSAPHAAVWVRVDATRTVTLLEGLRRRGAWGDVRLSPLTVVAMALCDAVRHYPAINSSFDAGSEEVVVHRRVALGVAAATERGLIVPNVKGADTMDLVTMARALTTLVDTARAGTTAPADMAGTTITITNVGPFGVDAAVPILPPGTGAILVLGRLTPSPWVDGEAVVVRQVVELTLAFDHRHIDGALASRVLRHVADVVEDPAPVLIAP